MLESNPPQNITSLASNDLASLRHLHREIHDKIEALLVDPFADQIQIGRLKREKLRVKDAIERVRSEMIPNLDA
jgi:hypothetical protein